MTASTRHGHLAVAALAATLIVGDATTAPAFTPGEAANVRVA